MGRPIHSFEICVVYSIIVMCKQHVQMYFKSIILFLSVFGCFGFFLLPLILIGEKLLLLFAHSIKHTTKYGGKFVPEFLSSSYLCLYFIGCCCGCLLFFSSSISFSFHPRNASRSDNRLLKWKLVDVFVCILRFRYFSSPLWLSSLTKSFR